VFILEGDVQYMANTRQHPRPIHKYNVVSAEKMKKYKEKYRRILFKIGEATSNS